MEGRYGRLTKLFVEIDDDVNKALNNRDKGAMRVALTTMFDIWEDKDLYNSFDGESGYDPTQDILEKYRKVENRYVLLRYIRSYEEKLYKEIIKENEFYKMFDEVCFGIREKKDDFKHRGSFVTYLEDEKDTLKGLLLFNPNFMVSGMRMAAKVNNYISSKIIKESVWIYQGRVLGNSKESTEDLKGRQIWIRPWVFAGIAKATA